MLLRAYTLDETRVKNFNIQLIRYLNFIPTDFEKFFLFIIQRTKMEVERTTGGFSLAGPCL